MDPSVIDEWVASHGLPHCCLSPLLWSIANLSSETVLHVFQLEISGRKLRDLRFNYFVSVILGCRRGVWIDAISFQEAYRVQIAHDPVV